MSETREIDARSAEARVDELWKSSIIPALTEFIRIPNKSPAFDPQWQEHGHMDRAVELIRSWCADHALPDMKLEVIRLEGRTPLLWLEVPATIEGSDDTVLLYGHLDKQPEFDGWDDDLGPWKPVLRDDKLYGRGGADDGYAAFASLAALKVLHEQGVPHHRCVVLIEACEESGSPDLPVYIEHLADRIGSPSLVVCLDSGCGNYEQLWSTTSLRGIINCNLEVSLLSAGVHSGNASGIVPDSFRVARALLSRVEDETSGEIRLRDLQVEIPKERVEQARRAGEVLGSAVHDAFPWRQGAQPTSKNLGELVLNRTWRPALSITGASGLPDLEDAGNVSRPQTSLKLSMRVPPTLDAARAAQILVEALTKDPPYGARVRVSKVDSGGGWNAPPVAPWLERSLQQASQTYFGADAVYMGEGGSIPFMGMLGERFPKAQFLITGVLGPNSNAHGPNEFLHIPTGKRITACVAQVLRDHAVR